MIDIERAALELPFEGKGVSAPRPAPRGIG